MPDMPNYDEPNFPGEKLTPAAIVAEKMAPVGLMLLGGAAIYGAREATWAPMWFRVAVGALGGAAIAFGLFLIPGHHARQV